MARPARSPEELALLRTIAVTLATLAVAAAALATKGSAPPWLATALAVVAFLSAGAALWLSILEWRRHGGEGKQKPSRSGWLLLASVLALAAVAGASAWYLREANHQGNDVKFDNTPSLGPYRVNGTCGNRTCVLYERSAPSRRARKVARLREGQLLTITCQTKGEMLVVNGKPASDIWDRLYNPHSGPFVSDYFTNTPATDAFSRGLKRC